MCDDATELMQSRRSLIWRVIFTFGLLLVRFSCGIYVWNRCGPLVWQFFGHQNNNNRRHLFWMLRIIDGTDTNVRWIIADGIVIYSIALVIPAHGRCQTVWSCTQRQPKNIATKSAIKKICSSGYGWTFAWHHKTGWKLLSISLLPSLPARRQSKTLTYPKRNSLEDKATERHYG